MNTAVSVESRIARVDVTDETITAHLVDGRVIFPDRKTPDLLRAKWLVAKPLTSGGQVRVM